MHVPLYFTFDALSIALHLDAWSLGNQDALLVTLHLYARPFALHLYACPFALNIDALFFALHLNVLFSALHLVA